jgi:hypothetical protein
MNGLIPVVRQMVLCEEVVREGEGGRSVSLLRLVANIRPTHEPPYPHVLPRLSIYIQLTACRGPAQVRFRVIHANSNVVVWQGPPRTVMFPNDPLHVAGFSQQILNLPLALPGLYEVEFEYNGQVLETRPFVLL